MWNGEQCEITPKSDLVYKVKKNKLDNNILKYFIKHY